MLKLPVIKCCWTLLLLIVLNASAQKNIHPATEFVIDGKVKQAVHITLTEIEALPSKHIDSIVITIAKIN
jgi:hypothetical protein